jgi:hypothetical protein
MGRDDEDKPEDRSGGRPPTGRGREAGMTGFDSDLYREAVSFNTCFPSPHSQRINLFLTTLYLSGAIVKKALLLKSLGHLSEPDRRKVQDSLDVLFAF